MIYRVILYSVLLFWSCKAPVVPQKTNEITIVFGIGGGFTGLNETYLLSEKGALSHVYDLNKTDTIFLKQCTKEDISGIMTLVNSNEIKQQNLSESGNMTVFIQIFKNKELYKDFKWPSGYEHLPASISSLHKQLISLIPPKE